MELPAEIVSVEFFHGGGFVEGLLVAWDKEVPPPLRIPDRYNVSRSRAGVTEQIPVQSVRLWEGDNQNRAVYVNLDDDDLQPGDEVSLHFLGISAFVVPIQTKLVGVV